MIFYSLAVFIMFSFQVLLLFFYILLKYLPSNNHFMPSIFTEDLYDYVNVLVPFLLTIISNIYFISK